MPAAKAAGRGRVRIPLGVLDRTLAALKGHGDMGLEAHALWVGRPRDGSFAVTDVWFPRQRRMRCSYEVAEAEEFRINRMLDRRGLATMCQVHTHPAGAYHSAVDDAGSALSLPGSLSVVVPNYGRIRGSDLSECAVYMYDGACWHAMPGGEVRRTFQVT